MNKPESAKIRSAEAGNIFLILSSFFLFVLMVFCMNVGSARADDGLVGYWTMDGEDINWRTGKVADKSGNYNSGQIAGMGTSTAPIIGKIGQALKFDGTNDVINAGDMNIIDGAVELTVSAWIKINNVSKDNDVFAKGNHNTNEPLLFWRDDAVGAGSQSGNADCMSVLVYDGDTMAWTSSPSGSINDLNWHHVLFTFRANIAEGLKIYIDGVNINNASTVNVNSIQSTSNNVTIGSPTAGVSSNIMNGNIDEVRVYNRALSAEEVSILYNTGLSKFDASPTLHETDGLVGYWTMDGEDINWRTGKVTDKSGTGNFGQMVGMSTTTAPVAGKIGQALKFAGTVNKVTLPAEVNTALQAFTVTAWINPNALTARNEIVNMHGFYFNLQSSLTKIYITGVTSAYHADSRTINANNWTMVTAKWDGQYITIYVNGVAGTPLAKSGTATDTANSGIGDCTGGCSGDDKKFFGSIDEVRVYNRALLETEISSLYNAGSAKFDMSPVKKNPTGLAGYWTLDGADIAWRTGKVTDKSGNGKTSQIVGMTTSTSPIAGKVGQGLYFDGVNDYLLAPSVALGTNSTIAVWVKLRSIPALSSYNLPLFKVGTASMVYSVNKDYGPIRFTYSQSTSGCSAPVEVVANKWYHLAFVNNATTDRKTIYINGVLQAMTGAAGCSSTNMTLTNIGYESYWNKYTNAIMDDIRAYNRVLSASEIQSLYRQVK